MSGGRPLCGRGRPYRSAGADYTRSIATSDGELENGRRPGSEVGVGGGRGGGGGGVGGGGGCRGVSS